MVKLSDFYPYDRNKGGIQELHHKIESKTLQYWGEDSGILIGITPIYKRRLWSEEVKVVNDKMTNMKTRTYEGVQHGDWVRCVLCGAQMLLPCGADKCPECSSEGTLTWVDEDKQETIRFDNGASNSMFWETFEKLDLDAGDATWLHQSCCCDHCVNHLGIDLCDCGSEHKVGECECGSQKAHDTLGIKYDSFEAILKNFG